MVAEKVLIEDFGEKIGGANKENWKSREMLLSEIKDLNHRELLKYVVKANVWKKPDYELMVENGLDPKVAFLVKKVYDAFPAKLESNGKDFEKDLLQAERYLKFANEVSTVVNECKVTSDFFKMFNKVFTENGYFDYSGIGGRGNWTEKARECPFISNKFAKITQLSSYDILKAEREAVSTGFPNKVEAWKKNLDIRELKLAGSDEKEFCIIKKKSHMYEIIGDTFKTKEDAENHLNSEEFRKKMTTKKFGIDITRPQLESIKRKGIDYRNGKDITTDDFMRVFKFRGGEFGNWNTQGDRQQNLNMSYDSLVDLSKLLNIQPSSLSLEGRLAIAYGARGSGRKAAAHYEPAACVINLTKMNGAGSLAHEWSHALDDHFARLSNKSIKGYASSGLSLSSELDRASVNAWNSIMKTIKYKNLLPEDIEKQATEEMNRLDKVFKTWTKDISDAFERKNLPKESYEKLIGSMFDRTISTEDRQNIFNDLNTYYKKEIGKQIDRSTREAFDSFNNHYNRYIENFKNAKDLIRQGETNYFRAAKNLDETRSIPYYTNDTELFARAFESYIEDKLKSQGLRSDYLVYATNYSYGDFSPYPCGAERELLYDSFEKFFESLKELEKGSIDYTGLICEDTYINSDYKDLKNTDKLVVGVDEVEADKDINSSMEFSEASSVIENVSAADTIISTNTSSIDMIKKHLENINDEGVFGEAAFEIVDVIILEESAECINALLQFDGEVKDVDIYNYLSNEDNLLSINGIKVDIMPVKSDRTEEIKDYIEGNKPVEKIIETETIVKDLENEIKNNDLIVVIRNENEKAIVSPGEDSIQINIVENNQTVEVLNVDDELKAAQELCNKAFTDVNEKVNVNVQEPSECIGQVSREYIENLEGNKYIINIKDSMLEKLPSLEIPYYLYENNKTNGYSLYIKAGDRIKAMEDLGIRDKEVGKVSYEKFMKESGKTKYMLISGNELELLSKSNINFAAFKKASGDINIAIKENDLHRTLETIQRAKEDQLGNIGYNALKNIKGETIYRIYGREELDKLLKSDVKFSAFGKPGGKFNIAFKAADLEKIHNIVKSHEKSISK